MIILTGPNMAGKSTILRQIGLIVLMAQVGSFVPAQSARIGMVDRIFTRVGASDNLVRGQSTFMVEMSETSAILHTATARSLVLLDEIGRGTATYDGVSIAWAVSEHLHDAIGCKTVFATHYHELTQLADELAALRNYNVAVRESDERILFLTRLDAGCSLRRFCGPCWKQASAPCLAHRVFLLTAPALAVLSLLPLATPIRPLDETGLVFGTPVRYSYTLAQQLIDFRLYPGLAALAFAVVSALLPLGRRVLRRLEPLVFAGVGLSSFSLLRFFLLSAYREHPVFTSLRDVTTYKGRCGRCEYGAVCGGSRARAYAWTGDLLEADPLCPFVPPAIPAA
jgi:hypothetical protein